MIWKSLTWTCCPSTPTQTHTETWFWTFKSDGSSNLQHAAAPPPHLSLFFFSQRWLTGGGHGSAGAPVVTQELQRLVVAVCAGRGKTGLSLIDGLQHGAQSWHRRMQQHAKTRGSSLFCHKKKKKVYIKKKKTAVSSSSEIAAWLSSGLELPKTEGGQTLKCAFKNTVFCASIVKERKSSQKTPLCFYCVIQQWYPVQASVSVWFFCAGCLCLSAFLEILLSPALQFVLWWPVTGTWDQILFSNVVTSAAVPTNPPLCSSQGMNQNPPKKGEMNSFIMT